MRVPPKRGSLALFFSYETDMTMHTHAIHGACPVPSERSFGTRLILVGICTIYRSSGPSVPCLPGEALPPFALLLLTSTRGRIEQQDRWLVQRG